MPLLQAEDANSPVLPEMMIERERAGDPASLEHGEGDGVAERPVLIEVARENLLGALLFSGERRNDRKTARQQPLTRYGPPELPEQ